MRGDLMVGAYPLLIDETCRWIAADFDGHNGNAFDEALLLVEKLREFDIEPMCNVSQSGNGVHVRLIFADPTDDDAPIEAFIARMMMESFIKEAGCRTIGEGGAFDRLFPAQDSVAHTGREIGNLIAMPLHMGAAHERGGSLLLDRQFNPIPLGDATWDAIEMYEPIKRLDIYDSLHEMGHVSALCDCTALAQKNRRDKIAERRATGSSPHGNIVSLGERMTSRDLEYIFDNCDFFQYTLQHPLNYFEWLTLASNLAVFDGKGGRRIFNVISSHDTTVDSDGRPRYDEQNTIAKFKNVVRTMKGPITCKSLAVEGFRCPMLNEHGVCSRFYDWQRGYGPSAPSKIPFWSYVKDGVEAV